VYGGNEACGGGVGKGSDAGGGSSVGGSVGEGVGRGSCVGRGSALGTAARSAAVHAQALAPAERASGFARLPECSSTIQVAIGRSLMVRLADVLGRKGAVDFARLCFFPALLPSALDSHSRL
jgi:hypothetical protein